MRLAPGHRAWVTLPYAHSLCWAICHLHSLACQYPVFPLSVIAGIAVSVPQALAQWLQASWRDFPLFLGSKDSSVLNNRMPPKMGLEDNFPEFGAFFLLWYLGAKLRPAVLCGQCCHLLSYLTGPGLAFLNLEFFPRILILFLHISLLL